MSNKDIVWYLKINDLIGGWCITSEDKTPSEGAFLIADFTRKEDGQHIVNLHNNWLKLQKKPKLVTPPQPPFRLPPTPPIPPRMY